MSQWSREQDYQIIPIALMMWIVILLNILVPDLFFSFRTLANVPFLVFLYFFSMILLLISGYQFKSGNGSIRLLSISFALFGIIVVSLILIGFTYSLFSIDLLLFGYILQRFLSVRNKINSTMEYV